MTYCMKFIDSMNTLNFYGPSGKIIQQACLASAYQALQKEQQDIQTKLQELSSIKVDDLPHAAVTELEKYRTQQDENLKYIDVQLKALQEAAGTSTDLSQPFPIENREQFIADFSSYFRNIRHLADTLSDAPEAIKALQSELYTNILFKLKPLEQEEQLKTLSDENLKDLIEQARSMYDKPETNPTLKNQCQQAVKLGMFEIVRRHCEKIDTAVPVVSDEANQKKYQVFINTLQHQLPDVGASDIIDNISDYKDSKGQSIGDLLAGVEERLNINNSSDLQDDVKIATLKTRAMLCHRLRFGQDDRRAYVEKIKKNLGADLFWGRDIQDLRSFGSISEEQFGRMMYERYKRKMGKDPALTAVTQQVLTAQATVAKAKADQAKAQAQERREKAEVKRSPPRSPDSSPQKSLPVEPSPVEIDPQQLMILRVRSEKLNDVLDKIKKTLSSQGKAIPAGNTPEKNAAKKKDVYTIIQTQFENIMPEPTLELLETGDIQVNLYTLSVDEDFVKNIYELISRQGGSLRKFDVQFLQTFMQDSNVMDKITINPERLPSFDAKEIETFIRKQPEAVRSMLLDKITAFKKEIGDRTISEAVESLSLDTDRELLLRKLLEIQHFETEIISKGVSFNSDVKKAFKELESGKYNAALQISGLKETVDQVYQHLSRLDVHAESDKAFKTFIEKATKIEASSLIRKDKSEALKAAFNAPNVKEAVAAVFLKEYLNEPRDIRSSSDSIADSLKLTASEKERTRQDIHSMAADLTRLMDRTSKGQPAISSDEQAAYFKVLQTIAKALAEQSPQRDMNDAVFKIKHSSGPQTIDIAFSDEGKLEVPINTGSTKLPYSLIKRKDGDFIFSYGGSRGMVTPFEALDTALGKPGRKKQGFMRSKLLGEGQYGAVKEVESLLSGLNQVLKKGYVKPRTSTEETEKSAGTFTKEAVDELKYRAFTSRNDPLYRVERDVLIARSAAAKKSAFTLDRTTYWTKAKKRKAGQIFSEDTAEQYYIQTRLAKGDTYAAAAKSDLKELPKESLAYHDPTKRTVSMAPAARGSSAGAAAGAAAASDTRTLSPEEHVRALDDLVKLSQEIVKTAQDFQTEGFSHNDIKPENFLYRKNSDGTYTVEFIDWATGGFELKQEYAAGAKAPTLEDFFKAKFGEDLKATFDDDGVLQDSNGRFVKQVINEDGSKTIEYGIKPTLEIIHGAHNGTLPYISPSVLEGGKTPIYGRDPALNTVLNEPASTELDDWALTAMTFGICNREAYFQLVKGRTVNDYLVPGILASDGEDPAGLKADKEKFKEMFGCELETGADKDQVMYIPGNMREGEPLHLYRRLSELKQILTARPKLAGESAEETAQIKEIDKILTTVHSAVAKKKGLKKEDLQTLLSQAQSCIAAYEVLNSRENKKALAQEQALQQVFAAAAAKTEGQSLTDDELLHKIKGEASLSRLEVLCRYPSTGDEKKKAIDILDKAFPAQQQLIDKFIGSEANTTPPPGRHLLKACIEQEQEEILTRLLSKITSASSKFIEQVKDDALLHYAAEKGMVGGFNALVSALKKAGASDNDIFDLMKKEYDQRADQSKTDTPIKWSTNCFAIAIRNNNADQLETILKVMPKGITDEQDKIIGDALHLSASLGHAALYQQIINAYDSKMSLEKQLGFIRPPDNTSPYHLFLTDAATTQQAIEWDEFTTSDETKQLAREFLLSPTNPTAYPLLLAAKNGNIAGVKKLFELGEAIPLSEKQWTELFEQRDEQGKNILNYLLEKGHKAFVPDLIEKIQAHGQPADEVMVNLLSNPRQINPLINYMQGPEDTATQLKYVVAPLLDGICKEFNINGSTLEQEKSRITALLMNQEWLIDKASSPEGQEQLRGLLQNSALSNPLKNVLFKELLTYSETKGEASPTATAFYKTLVEEVSASLEKSEAATALEAAIIKDIRERVARGTQAGLIPLIEALTGDFKATAQLRAELISAQKQVETLEEEKARSAIDIEQDLAFQAIKLNVIQEQLELQKNETTKAQEQLTASTASLSKAVSDVTRLTAQVADLTKASTQSAEQKIELDNTRAELIRAQGTEKAATAQVKQQQLKLSDQEARIDSLNRELDSINTQNRNLTSEVSTLSVGNRQQRALIEKLEREGASNQRQEMTLRTELDSLRRQLDVEKQVNQTVSLKLIDKTAELNRQAGELEAIQGENNRLEIQVNALTFSKTSLEKEIHDVNEKLHQSTHDVLTKQAEIDKQGSKLSEIEAELTRKKIELEKAQRLSGESEKDGRAKDVLIKTLQDKIDTLSNDCDLLRNRIHIAGLELQTSQSNERANQRKIEDLNSNLTMVKGAKEIAELELKGAKASLATISELLKLMSEKRMQDLSNWEEMNRSLLQTSESDAWNQLISQRKADLDQIGVRNELRDARNEAASSTSQLRELRDQLTGVQQQLQESHAALTNLKAQLEAEKKLHQSEQEKVKQLRSQIQEKEDNVGRLTEVLTEKEAQNTQLSIEIKKSQEQHRDMEEALNSARNDSEEVRAVAEARLQADAENIAEKQQLLQEEKASVEKLRKELILAEHDLRRVTQQLDKTIESEARAVEEVKELAAKLQQQDEGRTRLLADIKSLKESNRQLMQQNRQNRQHRQRRQ